MVSTFFWIAVYQSARPSLALPEAEIHSCLMWVYLKCPHTPMTAQRGPTLLGWIEPPSSLKPICLQSFYMATRWHCSIVQNLHEQWLTVGRMSWTVPWDVSSHTDPKSNWVKVVCGWSLPGEHRPFVYYTDCFLFFLLSKCTIGTSLWIILSAKWR